MEYTKQIKMAGSWVKGGDIKSGIKAKLLTPAERTESQFKNEDGTPKFQDVAKIKFEDKPTETFNIAINRATINALIDAFGTKSEDWVGKPLTTQVEKMIVAGRNVRAVYLIPEGYELTEDDGGYTVITKIGGKEEGKQSDYDEVDPESIPF